MRPFYDARVSDIGPGDLDEAIVWLEKARNAAPVQPGLSGYLAAAYGLKGETKRAVAELAESRRLNSGRPSSIAKARTTQHWGAPKLLALYEAAVFAGWRKAGMPEDERSSVTDESR